MRSYIKIALLSLLTVSVMVSCSQSADKSASHAKWEGFECGMGIGGWLTNYKRFNVLPDEHRMKITEGDLEHFREYITEWDVKNIADMTADSFFCSQHTVCYDFKEKSIIPSGYSIRSYYSGGPGHYNIK